MNWTRSVIALSVLLIFSVAMPGLRVHAQSTSTDADSAAIRKVIDDFVGAFNRHDAAGWAMPFGDDGDFTNVSGLTKHGRKEVEERFKVLFAGPLKNAHRTVTVRHLRFAKPDVAFADAEWALEGSLAGDGSANPVRKGIFTFVLVKQDGYWKFADFHESEFVTMK
ncbi:MAG TPA: SgcJ/EcaC family oxidoreductase [Candidatus Acidoferrales bacterium]|nr:SgcJ/EcaC family oxidoreductase [Candidatus Acidoferrales bacterium]